MRRHSKRELQQPLWEQLLSTRNKELWDLRENLLVNSPQALVDYLFYKRTISSERRNKILSHLSTLTDISPKDSLEKPRILLSDIDNTFLSSRDKRYQNQATPYPGIKQLYAALLNGSSSEKLQIRRKGSIKAFLTARPGNPTFDNFTPLSGKMKSKTATSLDVAGIPIEKQLILWGDFIHCIPRPSGIYKALGEGKMKNFQRMLKLYTGYQFIFFGDNGEADLKFAEKMLKLPEHNVSEIFIHDLNNMHPDKVEQYRARRIFIYTSTIDAVIIALQNELITPIQALEIARSTVDETVCTNSESNKSVLEFNKRVAVLIKDLGRLNELIDKPKEIARLITQSEQKEIEAYTSGITISI
jgi:hypothetical protein